MPITQEILKISQYDSSFSPSDMGVSMRHYLQIVEYYPFSVLDFRIWILRNIFFFFFFLGGGGNFQGPVWFNPTYWCSSISKLLYPSHFHTKCGLCVYLVITTDNANNNSNPWFRNIQCDTS